MKLKIRAVAALLGLCAAMPTMAVTIRDLPIGDVSNAIAQFPVFTPAPGDFIDNIFFSVTGAGAGFVGAANLVIDNPVFDGIETSFEISNISLFNSFDALLATDTNGSDGFSLFSLLPAPGVYRFTVVGVANGTVNGAYSGFVQTEVAAVPEPETYALMLAGVGAVAAAVRRRRSAAAPAAV